MTNSYTGSDIEIHLTDWTAGMDTTGIDIEGSNRLAQQMVEIELSEAFPGHSVSVFMDERTYGESRRVVRLSDDIEESDVLAVIDRVGADYDAWVVDAAQHDTPDPEGQPTPQEAFYLEHGRAPRLPIAPDAVADRIVEAYRGEVQMHVRYQGISEHEQSLWLAGAAALAAAVQAATSEREGDAAAQLWQHVRDRLAWMTTR